MVAFLKIYAILIDRTEYVLEMSTSQTNLCQNTQRQCTLQLQDKYLYMLLHVPAESSETFLKKCSCMFLTALLHLDINFPLHNQLSSPCCCENSTHFTAGHVNI